MVMPARPKIWRFDPQLAGHPQVNAEPKVFRETEKHLLAVRGRIAQRRPGKRPLHYLNGGISKSPSLGVEMNLKDLVPQTAIPLFAIKFDLGQFRHEMSQFSSAFIKKSKT